MVICLGGLLAFLVSCSQSSAPTAPVILRGPVAPFSVRGYGASLDSSYFKVWSDSSWEGYTADTLMNGTVYKIIVDDGGNESVYGPGGYSGFGWYGGDIVLFDSTLASLPDTMVGGTAYSMKTTFSYQGATYTLVEQETLIDTTTVSVSFGTFADCRIIQSILAINGSVQSATVSWLARGPSDIMRQYSTIYGPYIVQMVYGEVNGRQWGMAGSPAIARQLPITRTAAERPSIQSIAPMILKNIGKFRTTAHTYQFK